MATIIPSVLPSKASKGEEKLFSVLQEKLPDDFYVWYEPSIKGRYPDFIILAPQFGLLVIEVKGWYPGQILQADSNVFTIKQKNDEVNTIEKQKSPLRQCKDYLDLLLNHLKTFPVLTDSQGKYQGKLTFPIGLGAVMSNITTEQATQLHLDILLPQHQVAYRDEFLSWENYTPEQLVFRLKQMFTVQFSFSPLTQDQINTIRGTLYPEIVIQEIPARTESIPSSQSLIPSATILKTLDSRQETLAKSIGEGHRVFFGVSGSGKTLLLLARAKMLAQQNPQRKILILCFNISLASHLRSLLCSNSQAATYSNIEVFHFHAWAKSCLGILQHNSSENFDELVGERLLNHLNSLDIKKKWDSILVDEAHTFVPLWFRCCVAALKNSQEGDLIIVADGSQSLYKRANFTWKEVGVKAQGRTISKKFDLDRNYRNTQQVLNAAWSVLQPVHEHTVYETEEITFPAVTPSQALRQGTNPAIHVVSFPEKAIIASVQNLLAEGYAPEEIAIIYRHANKKLIEQLMKDLKELGIATYWITKDKKSKERYRVTIPGVRILTSLSSLGLEFKAVLILWLEQFGDCVKLTDSGMFLRKELYVAMTRTQEYLHLFSKPENPLLAELKQSNYFD